MIARFSCYLALMSTTFSDIKKTYQNWTLWQNFLDLRMYMSKIRFQSNSLMAATFWHFIPLVYSFESMGLIVQCRYLPSLAVQSWLSDRFYSQYESVLRYVMVGLQAVIVALPGHTHLLIDQFNYDLINEASALNTALLFIV